MSVPNLIPVVGGLLVATAKVRGMTFVTCNTADIVRIGVLLLYSFEADR